jgi:phosphoribosyl 1,2-cyclic phosphate phosphodiesterase
LRKKKHVSHFNLEEALAFAEKVKAGKTLLTHISHLMGFHKEVNLELPSGTSLAYDGLFLDL